MPDTSPPGSVVNPRRPDLRLPVGSCDTHCHVFGPPDRFPYAPDANYTPHAAPIESLESLWDLLGFDRAVIVQSTVHGTDHAAAVDALRRGVGRYRGVAIIRPDTPDDEVARLHDEGFRGARLHFMPHLGTTPPSPEDIAAVVDKVQPYNWHISLHLAGTGIVDYQDLVRSLPGRVVIDHMARVNLSQGTETPEVHTLLKLLELENVWVKLSGADRLAVHPPSMQDSAEYAALLARHAPDRVVWGTDHPHPNTHGYMPDDGDLVDTLATVAPTEADLQRLLVDNPTRLFDFDR
ncbi:MAG: amidohydrolase family protein [Propionibacteriales bacterium]|nr:amidohydrolase family protein [Propionibacteriales bacterium]